MAMRTERLVCTIYICILTRKKVLGSKENKKLKAGNNMCALKS